VHEASGPGRQGAVRKQPDGQPLDDWFGDISGEDWSEDAAELAEQRRATPVRQERSTRERYSGREGLAVSHAQALPVATTEARRAAVRRRRAVAAVVLLLLIGPATAAAVLLLRASAEAPVTAAPESPIVATATPTETDPVATTPSTTPTPTPSAAPTANVPTLTLPEGMKLQRGESDGESDLTVSTDPELIAELQRALARAGYDPGSPDGTFGPNTEEAVVTFQQANGLAPDGIVGPETADALNRAVVAADANP
jgi:murein L,D-transpeptidase YcbB/YkuD